MPEDDRYFTNTIVLDITATDPYGETATCTLQITVMDNIVPKIANKPKDLTFYNQTVFAIDLSTIFIDGDNDPLILYAE